MGVPGALTAAGMIAPMRLEAPAKINLQLAVTGRRSDGYHELDSVVVLLELADRLVLQPGCSGLRLEGDARDVPATPDQNLAWRGLVAGMGAPPDLACLTVEKRVAVRAGLGGGSSDAAAAWRLGRRWRGASEAPTADELVSLAHIGADVPFFAAQVAAARVRGAGERVEPLLPPDPPLDVVVALAPIGLSTATVFAALRPEEWTDGGLGDPGAAGAAGNDLAAAARRLRPEIDDLFAMMTAAGGVPHLTGSGPTVFAIADGPDHAAGIHARLERAGVRAAVTRTRAQPARIESMEEESNGRS
jgi:4-diphosphocytidyl-2-C-methyl-D-erythritol kinase